MYAHWMPTSLSFAHSSSPKAVGLDALVLMPSSFTTANTNIEYELAIAHLFEIFI